MRPLRKHNATKQINIIVKNMPPLYNNAMLHKRQIIRLKNYDYSQGGAYFVTICAQNKEKWFSKIENNEIILNKYGEIAKKFWIEIPKHFSDIDLNVFTIMPNHIHGIIFINKTNNMPIINNPPVVDAYMRPLQNRTKMLLSVVIQQYKSAITRKINKLVDNTAFAWQRSFYDHIIRSEKSLENIHYYIMNNHLKWAEDIENMENPKNSVNTTKDYYGGVVG